MPRINNKLEKRSLTVVLHYLTHRKSAEQFEGFGNLTFRIVRFHT